MSHHARESQRRCTSCGGTRALSIFEGKRYHKACMPSAHLAALQGPPRPMIPVPPSAFRTQLAPGAPWPFGGAHAVV